MELLLDGGLVVVAFLFIASGFRRGAAGTLAHLGGTIVAIAAAAFLASMFAEPLYTHFVRNSFMESINGTLSGNQDAATKVQEMFAALPGFISNSLARYGLSVDSVNAAIADANEQASGAVVDLLSPIVIDFIRMVLMLIFIIVLMVVVRLAVRAINGVFRLPVLHQLNSLLGGVFGVVQGAIVIMLVCVAIQLVTPMFSQVPPIFSSEVIDSTNLFKYIYYNNPVYSLFNLL